MEESCNGFKYKVGKGNLSILYKIWLKEGPIYQVVSPVNINRKVNCTYGVNAQIDTHHWILSILVRNLKSKVENVFLPSIVWVSDE